VGAGRRARRDPAREQLGRDARARRAAPRAAQAPQTLTVLEPRPSSNPDRLEPRPRAPSPISSGRALAASTPPAEALRLALEAVLQRPAAAQLRGVGGAQEGIRR